MTDATIPAWISAAVRYLVVLVAGYFGIESEAMITQIVALVIGIGTMAFGIYRTNKLEKAPAVR